MSNILKIKKECEHQQGMYVEDNQYRGTGALYVVGRCMQCNKMIYHQFNIGGMSVHDVKRMNKKGTKILFKDYLVRVQF